MNLSISFSGFYVHIYTDTTFLFSFELKSINKLIWGKTQIYMALYYQNNFF